MYARYQKPIKQLIVQFVVGVSKIPVDNGNFTKLSITGLVQTKTASTKQIQYNISVSGHSTMIKITQFTISLIVDKIISNSRLKPIEPCLIVTIVFRVGIVALSEVQHLC